MPDYSSIHLVITDFDGVLTDNMVYVDDGGHETVRCNRGDGMGVDMLRAMGIRTMVMSSESNPVVGKRCEKLGVACLQGLGLSKGSALERLILDENLSKDKILYIGNDVNDVPCFEQVGLSCAVADARSAAKQAARVILSSKGGDGALREVADLIAQTRGFNVREIVR